MSIQKLRIFSKFLREEYKLYKKVPGKNLIVHRDKNICLELNYDALGLTYVEMTELNGYLRLRGCGLGRYQLHVLKCLAFHKKPRELENPIVNHIDGNKLNNRASNLEWTSYAGNLVHAFKNGLRTDNKSGTAVDLITGEKFTFYSLNDFCRQINVNAGYLTIYMRKKRDYPFRRRYVITMSGEVPPNITIDDIWKAGSGGELPIAVTDNETGERYTFTSFVGMKKGLGVNYAPREKLVAGKPRVFGKGKHTVEVLTDYHEIMATFENDPNYTKREVLKKRENKKPLPIEVSYPNGDIKIFPSIVDAANSLNSTKAALQRRIQMWDGEWRGHKVRFLNP